MNANVNGNENENGNGDGNVSGTQWNSHGRERKNYNN